MDGAVEDGRGEGPERKRMPSQAGGDNIAKNTQIHPVRASKKNAKKSVYFPPICKGNLSVCMATSVWHFVRKKYARIMVDL
jgi:hypothetical protein